jgi:hypothetical protein
VYIESSTEVDGIPTGAQLSAALDLINYDQNGLATRRPAGALVSTYAITRLAFDVRVLDVAVPGDLATVRDQINAALSTYFLGREPYIVGLSVGTRGDTITQSAVGGVVNDIVSAAGGTFSTALLYSGAVPSPLYTLGEGEKSKLGDLTYV